MERFYKQVIKYRKLIMLIFIAMAVICAFCRQFISVNYNMNDYLPQDSESTVALDVMDEEFDSEIPNARVLIHDVSISEALDYKEKLENVDGVISVNWLDDTYPVTVPLEVYEDDAVETYYKDGNALYSLTIDEEKENETVPEIREVIGDDNCMTGNAVSTAVATESTETEIQTIAIIAVIIVFLILMLTTESWVEPLLVMGGLGLAIVINAGSNLIFGEISFVTNAAGNILQLAVSLDYSVFLIHRFSECRQEQPNAELAMQEALVKSTGSILSSGLTTVIGFAALCMMRFRIGPDLGIALAKGVGISLITVFLFMPGLILICYPLLDKTVHKPFLPPFRKFGGFILKTTLAFVLIFGIMIVPSYVMSTNNEYYYGSSHIFSTGTQYGDDTAEIERIFGESDTYVLMVPRGDEKSERALGNELEDMDKVTSVLSMTSFTGGGIPTDAFPDKLADQLQSDNYRRIVISLDIPYEGDEANTMIESIKSLAEKYYPDEYYLAGAGVSTYDLMNTVTADMTSVNIISIGAVFLILLIMMRNVVLPVVLVMTIETAVWINLSVPYLTGSALFYIAYLIISSIQLGATVDYAILFTERYRENRETLDRKQSVIETVSNVTASILTSGTVMVVVGFLLGKISTHGLLSQLGYLLGRGTICSLICVLFVLPGLLYLTDRLFMKKKGSN